MEAIFNFYSFSQSVPHFQEKHLDFKSRNYGRMLSFAESEINSIRKGMPGESLEFKLASLDNKLFLHAEHTCNRGLNIMPYKMIKPIKFERVMNHPSEILPYFNEEGLSGDYLTSADVRPYFERVLYDQRQIQTENALFDELMECNNELCKGVKVPLSIHGEIYTDNKEEIFAAA